MLISEIMAKAWVKAGDANQATISPFMMLNAYNDTNRIVRKIILDAFPDMLETTQTTNTTAGQPLTLTSKALRITDVRVTGEKIYPIDSKRIDDLTATGKPEHFYMATLSSMKFYPSPDAVYATSVTYIPSYTDAVQTVDTGYPSEIEMLMLAYMVSILTGQDTGATTLASEVGKILNDINNDVVVMGGYYDVSQRSTY